MEITIQRTSLIYDVQQAFSEAYPFLRVEFFRAKHSKGAKLFSKEDKVPSFTRIGDLLQPGNPGKINIDGSRTVTELEKECLEMTGLQAQVLRRSGNSWIQTSLTDDWSLERQNREAELLSLPQTAVSRQEKMEDDNWDNL
jgi:hypothetical protein